MTEAREETLVTNGFIQDICVSVDQFMPRWRVQVNKLLQKFGSRIKLKHPFDNGDMMNLECKMNLYHLISSLKLNNVTGDFVDLGCFDGKDSAMMYKLKLEFGLQGEYYLYDNFVQTFGRTINRDSVFENFKKNNLPEPNLVEADFRVSIPEKLPQSICFSHIDVCDGGDAHVSAEKVYFLLENVYPRLSAGGIIVLMDYTSGKRKDVYNINPGVKIACDRFFEDKPEKVQELYAGYFAQGYVRKKLLPSKMIFAN